jgi:hypothetical protein
MVAFCVMSRDVMGETELMKRISLPHVCASMHIGLSLSDCGAVFGK